MSRRAAFVAWCRKMLEPLPPGPHGEERRRWYKWGGKNPETGLDCSGFVTAGLLAVGGPDWRAFHNAQRLWDELPPADEPIPGDLSFYRSSNGRRVVHVMVVLGPSQVPGHYAVCGASGGDSSTTDVLLARQQRAFVKKKPTHIYRSGFCGFRTFTPLDIP